MAAHQLAIAKASFSAALLRPDPTSLSRDDITTFHTLLDNALSHCSRINVQTCKEWLLRHVVPSPNRVGVLGKYLIALSTSFDSVSAKELPSSTRPSNKKPSGKRKRLHILYLLNDILHHAKYHLNEGVGAFVNFSSSLQPHVIELVGLAASFDRKKNPKHHQKLDMLLDAWYDHGYYAAEYVDKLRELVKNSESVDAIKASVSLLESASDIQSTGSKRDAPYIMPASHGDPSTPFYDLPAGNFVPHIIPDSTTPIRPDTVKPLQFLAGPADQKLVGVLKKFFQDVDHIYGSIESDLPENASLDVDELGQTVVRDEKTGEIIDTDTYYGWSREFCEQMKKRRSKGTSRRSCSYSSGDDERYGKRRHSDNNSRYDSRSRSRNPSRRRYSRSPSSSDSRNASRPRFSAQSRSRSNSYSPKPASPAQPHPTFQQNKQQPAPPPSVPNPSYPFNGAASFPPQFTGNAPPPPPMNYNNAWPTPHGAPPPMYPGGGQHMVPPGIANFPQQYQPPANQSAQYGRQPPFLGQQMPMGAFPPPWQGGHHGHNQGENR
ncbi:conserved hypothetical protein [Talaromyces stipitatus ATCC 10500]|uniref:CID domain-containing protein n=1 Tax=Talaromyces stipitatus (strain ATCC 10500 / CBS 375.48 / QM 6759 / NRRL 1006) TaxID=441959 RepID=B8MDH9_TALSN|nr:uncharacterized protein TSTA_117270 [Talaromyces stipitatus ATCC 10500]EED17942.1 conserved hypothetical protein [Talaromyces stipitatus ATCC 10500]